MYTCPNCHSNLAKVLTDIGRFWSCPVCNGRAVTLPVIQKVVPQKIINKIWQEARSTKEAGDRSCPACDGKMKVVSLGENTQLYLDICVRCYLVWFDPGEFGKVAEADLPHQRESSAASKASLAVAELKLLQEQRKAALDLSGAPDNWWEIIPAIFGLPIEYRESVSFEKPVMTWGLAALMILAYVISLSDVKTITTNWGLIPADPYRHFGATFVTSFFLHGGFFHLLSNLYFLLVFGDNVEEDMGQKKYLLLIAAAALLGDVFHILADPRATIALIGASGGISGIILYYALRYPKTRIGMLIFFRWYRISVGYMTALWLLFQLFGVLRQIAGYGDISALAHLGGASAGFLFWFHSRQSRSNVDKEIAMQVIDKQDDAR